MTRFVDFADTEEPLGRCVILPGRNYTPDGPVLFFAAQAALARGWAVRQVWWQVPELETVDELARWVGRQLEEALDGYQGRVLVVAKSLGTLAAPVVATQGWDAAWLTPLLDQPDVVTALASCPRAQLVAIGSEDPFFRADVLDALPGERVVVPGDHVLRVPGDITGTLAGHTAFVEAFDAWLVRLQP